jgi:hypothetical protein
VPVLFVSIWILPFALFALFFQRRCARFRALARELGGEHLGRWPLSPGRIHGADFEVVAEKAGKAYRTVVRREAPTPAGTFLLRPAFFARFPDWDGVRVPGLAPMRAFLWEVQVVRHLEPNAKQRAALLEWLPARLELSGLLEAGGVDEIRVADGTLSTSLRGIETRPERLRAVLEALRALEPAERVRAVA